MLFTLLLGILLIVPTITANSLADNDNQKRLIKLKDIYEKGGISEAEYKAAEKLFLSKEDKSDKKLKKNKKSFSLKKKYKKKIIFNPFKNKKDEDEEEITEEKIKELGEIIKFDETYYTEGMEKKFRGCNNSFKCRGQKAGTFLFNAFNKSPQYGQRHPGDMIKAMAMFEVFYAQKLYDTKKNLERYKKLQNDEYTTNLFTAKKIKSDKKKIRSLFGINKGRKNMRKALGMTMDTPTKDAIKKFWLLGEFLDFGVPKKHGKIAPELKERQKLLDNYKFQIANLKKKLENDKEEEAKKTN